MSASILILACVFYGEVTYLYKRKIRDILSQILSRSALSRVTDFDSLLSKVMVTLRRVGLAASNLRKAVSVVTRKVSTKEEMAKFMCGTTGS
jgi:hypothetical protein